MIDSAEVCKDFTNPGPPYRSGRELTIVKAALPRGIVRGVGVYNSTEPVHLGFGFKPTRYRGGFYNPDFQGVDFTEEQLMNPSFIQAPTTGFLPALSPYHTLVDKKLRPILSRANLGQSLAELREVPRMLQNTARDFRSSWEVVNRGLEDRVPLSSSRAGNSWLNLNFGWMPFIRDIGDVFNVVNDFDRLVRDTTNRNDRWDHRERVLEEKTVDTIIGTGSGMKCSPALSYLVWLCKPGAQWHSRFSYFKRELVRVWGSGDFKFYKPAFDMSSRDYGSGLNHLRRASTLLGTDITPSLLWNVTPWTWLADWFGNIGSVIETATAAGQDGVVSKNVFLMASFDRVITLNQEINMADGHLSIEFYRTVKSKQRAHAATPYNFGLTPTELSARQLSILAALGISKFT
jgi:hypothetical protein